MGERLLTIKVIANSRKEGVLDLGSGAFKIKVAVPPEKGKANKRMVELLAKHLKISMNQIDIIKGFKSKEKLVMISG